MKYKMSKLINKEESELRRLGFTESKIKDHYSKYWHIMLTAIGGKTVSKDDFVKACINHYGIDIINTPFNELATYHSRMKSKSLCLLNFQEKGFIGSTPYASRPKQLISADVPDLIQRFLNIERQKGNSNSTIKNKRSRIASFSSRYSLDNLLSADVLDYIDSFKNHERIGARLEMSIIKDFLGSHMKLATFRIRLGSCSQNSKSGQEPHVQAYIQKRKSN